MSATKSHVFWKFGGSLLGLAALAAILVAGNFLLGAIRLRKDLTEDKIYTLSEGTKAILRKLPAPVTLKYYVSSSATEMPPPLKTFATQIEDLLREYEIASGGNVILEKYDPKPDSDAEEWAEKYGLTGQKLEAMGAPLYLGLVACLGDDTYAPIPFFDFRQEQLLEYNITRLISRVSNPKKPVLGVMSSLPVMGERAMPFMMPGQPRPKNTPAWVAFQQLKEDYDVRQVGAEVGAIDQAIDVLVVVHPKNLTEKALFALDQFVLRGGRLLAFMDPMCLADAQAASDPMTGMRGQPSSTLGKLLGAWGVGFAPDQIAADLDAATRVSRGQNEVEDSPLFLSLRGFGANKKDVVTASINSLVLPCAGVLTDAGSSSNLTFVPLLTTSGNSMPIAAMMAQMGADAIRRDFRPGKQPLALAARIHGRFQTAFPDGRPADTNTPAADAAPALKEGAAPSTVILVADVDMLFDQFAVQELNFFGNRAYQPVNDNLAFLANAVDLLTGSSDLVAVRSRGRIDRPFDEVIKRQRVAQLQWMEEERGLQAKLDATREKLASMQTEKDKNQRYILSPDQQQAIEAFKKEQRETEHQLKTVRKNLREDIEALGLKVKTVNIVLMPALVCIAGLAFAYFRRAKTRHT